ncbi:MAG: hypothetical protein AB7S38_11020 [Vulcanimicrobiota bacterium]
MTAPVVLVALLLTLVMLLENRSTVYELTSESVRRTPPWCSTRRIA